MEKSVRDALAARFPDNLVKTRPGSFNGTRVRYIEANHIINRLQESCGGDWSFTVVSHQVTSDGEVVVHGRLEALGVVKEAFGRCTSTSRDGEVIRSVGDCYKAASTQALTVAARLLGVAAYLYGDDLPDVAPEEAPHTTPRAPVNPANRLTQKQATAIWNLGRRAGFAAAELRQLAQEKFHTGIEHLDRRQASALMDELGATIERQKGDRHEQRYPAAVPQ